MSTITEPPVVTRAATLLDHVEQCMRDLTIDGTDDASVAAHHHFASGGRRVRARLALSASAALGIPDDVAVSLAAGVELLHNATLVHDDLQDGDTVRRGHPTVWTVWGEDVAICLGDLMLSAAPAAIAAAGGNVAAMVRHTHGRVGELVRGQVGDVTPGHVVDVAGYERVAAGKSGPLLGLPLELPLLWAGHADAVDRAASAGDRFAVGYQAADDLGDTERDRIAGRPNLVNLLADAGLPDPGAAAERLAVERFAAARDLARGLPARAGEALAEHADAAIGRLNHTQGIA